MKPQRRKRCKTGEKPALKTLFAQPERSFYSMPEIELRSNRIVTEGCRRVISFTPEKIRLDMGKRVITFYGEELQIEFLTGKRLSIQGNILRVDLCAQAEEETT